MTERTTVMGLPVHSSARMLLVIDQPVLAKVITLALHHGRFHPRLATTSEEALAALGEWRPHLAVIDIDIAQGQILDQLADTAADATRVPVIALTRRGDLQTKLAAFAQGVDDILTVPFSTDELLARILVILRRTYDAALSFTPTITVGELEIDILNRHVHVGTSTLHLTALEQSVLYLLAANAGQVLTRDEILDTVWGTDYLADSNVVDRQIRNLRLKLKDGWRRPRYIATVAGQGYRFMPTTTDAEHIPAVPRGPADAPAGPPKDEGAH